MAETVQSILTDLDAVASRLGEPELSQRVHAVAEGAGSPKLQVLIVGVSGSGRFLLANTLLSNPDLLPVSPIPKQPLPLVLRFAESESVEVLLRDGLRFAAAPSRLRPLLMDSAGTAADARCVEVRTPAELLRSLDLRIEAIDAERSAEAWQTLLDATDFTLLVLRAPALLSQEEGKFILESLARPLADGRAAIAVNQVDLVPAEDRPGLVQRVRDFVGSIGFATPIVETSALDAGRRLRSGAGSQDSGDDQLQRLFEDVLDQHPRLKAASVHSAIASYLDEVQAVVARRRSLAGSDAAELRALQTEAGGREARWSARMERVQARIDVFVKTLTKEELLRSVEGFSETFRRQLPRELAAVHDIALLRRYVPEYIESIWKEFFEAQSPVVQAALTAELERLAEQIEADLRELAGDWGADWEAVAATFDPAPGAMRTFWMPRRGESGAGAFATKLQFGGLMLLIMPGLGLLGLISLSVGQAIRFAARRSEHAANKQAILDSFLASWPEMERQIRRQIERRFNEIAAELQASVAQVYERALESVRTVPGQAQAGQGAFEGVAGDLEQLAEEIVPSLRNRLDSLAPSPQKITVGRSA